MRAAADDEQVLVIANEFATVTVRRVHTRNGARLEIASPASGRSVRLDPLVLESLIWADLDTIARGLTTPFGADAPQPHVTDETGERP